MFHTIIRFFNSNKKLNVFDKEYKDAYRKTWIRNIRDYTP